MNQKKKSTPKRSWRDTPERLIRSFPGWPSPPSLHPDDSTIISAAAGNIAARAIVDAYAFRFPVRIVSEVLG